MCYVYNILIRFDNAEEKQMEDERSKEKSINIPNPVHYTGKTINVAGPLFPLVIAVVLSGFGSVFLGDSIIDAHDSIPDTQGTGNQAELILEHEQNFAELSKLAEEYKETNDYFSLDTKYGNTKEGQEDALKALAEEISTSMNENYMSLLLSGADKEEGAALSEENFSPLHEQFAEIANNTDAIKDLGYDMKIEAGALDECIAVNDSLSSQTTLGRYNNTKQLNQCMAEEHDNSGFGLALPIIIITFLAGTFGGGFALHTAAENMEEKPNRIKVKLPKRKKPKAW